jgi:hypothetical protein
MYIGASMSHQPANIKTPYGVHNTFWPYLPNIVRMVSKFVSERRLICRIRIHCRLHGFQMLSTRRFQMRTLATVAVGAGDLYEFVHKHVVADKSMLASARISCIHN